MVSGGRWLVGGGSGGVVYQGWSVILECGDEGQVLCAAIVLKTATGVECSMMAIDDGAMKASSCCD